MFIRYLACLMLAFFLNACGSEKKVEKAANAAPVRVETVTRANLSRNLQAVGNVRASASVGIVPRVAGEIRSVNFREGQEVKAGSQLIEIDPRPYAAALKEKQAILAKSEAQLAKAVDDRRRYGKLVDNGYVSREAFEQTATDAAALRATVQADKAAVESAALDLAYCTLTAPIDGRIGSLRLDKGNMVKSNDANPIVSIDTISPCYVVFSVPEANLPVILRHMQAGPMPVTATPVGGSPEQGQLTLVDNNVDDRTGTIRLRGVFPNPQRHLWPGQFVEVTLPLGEMENALIVPTKAIQAGREGSFIYVVDENDKAQYKKVHVNFENSGKSAISADLKPGEKVVVEGQVRLTPGIGVNILGK